MQDSDPLVRGVPCDKATARFVMFQLVHNYRQRFRFFAVAAAVAALTAWLVAGLTPPSQFSPLPFGLTGEQLQQLLFWGFFVVAAGNSIIALWFNWMASGQLRELDKLNARYAEQ